MLIPKTKHNYVGVEIECLIPNMGTNTLTNIFKQARLSRWVNVTTDSSVVDEDCRCGRCGYDCSIMGAEIRVLAKESEYKLIISKVVKVLLSVGAYVNETCGLHVHLDMRQRDAPTCALRLLEQQDVMVAMQPRHRVKSGYCSYMEIEAQMAAFYKWISLTPERYSVVNTTSYARLKTIEVRVHEGTLDSKEICDWIKWLVSVVDNKNITKWEEEYVQRRVERYSKEHQGFDSAL